MAEYVASKGGGVVQPPKKQGATAGRGRKAAPKPKPAGRSQPAPKPTPLLDEGKKKESPLEAKMRGIQEETRLAAEGETWSIVVGRKAKRDLRKEGVSGSRVVLQQGAKAPPKKAAAPTPPPTKKRVARPPKTAAVTLILASEAKTTYAEGMATARDKVDLKTIGITVIRPRRAVTGGLVLEIPGEQRMGRPSGGMRGHRGPGVSPHENGRDEDFGPRRLGVPNGGCGSLGRCGGLCPSRC
uniref:myosin-1-like n=1 Tax=Osmia lignaria TaxID=473952 RepID=UPI0014783306|nr:myosin-1-like [Osmia lignaria]